MNLHAHHSQVQLWIIVRLLIPEKASFQWLTILIMWNFSSPFPLDHPAPIGPPGKNECRHAFLSDSKRISRLQA